MPSRIFGLRLALWAWPLSLASPIDCSFESSYPHQYVAYKATRDLVLDGKLDDEEWTEVAWTEDFVDISTSTLPRLHSHAKIRWDEDYLYVGAYMEEPDVWANISHTCHCIDPDNDQIIFHDNDFEIFVDPDGSNHWYKEYEINAKNQTWILLLDKPYEDNGSENSSRVYGPEGFDMQPPSVCATYVEGPINDPTGPNQFWSVEVALPLAGLLHKSAARAPVHGDLWRINFSRVEWAIKVVERKYQKFPSCQSCPVPGEEHEDNWVWSPQGAINMHHPERWAFLQFADAPVGSVEPIRDPEWTVREVAMALYYAQRAYKEVHGAFTSNVSALEEYAPVHVLDGTCTHTPSVVLEGEGYVATVQSAEGLVAEIHADRLLTVRRQ